MVWMDEYAEYIYNRRPTYRSIDPGDISKQVALRERLQCKPFKWFMENIAFDLPKVYPPIEPNNFGDGYIRSIFDETLCVDAKGRTQYKRYT
jgi:polypeptide N-acetylgalactosaminyltransferase